MAVTGPKIFGERLIQAATLLAAALLAACIGLASLPGRAAELTVVATIAQIGEPLGQIAGDRARVVTLLGEGVDPHLYKPTRSDVAKVARAEIVLWTGLNLEAQMAGLFARLSATKPVVAVAEHVPVEHRIGLGDGAHDPHIWMDPSLWRMALQAAVDTLAEADPEGADAYRRRADAYFAQVDAVVSYTDRVIASIPAAARTMVTAHDAFAYFGRRYDLEVLGIQGISTESEAGLHRVEQLVDVLVEKRLPAVFVETSVSDRNLRALMEGAAARGHTVSIGGQLFSDAIGAPGTYEGTYLGMLDHNATAIARALGGQAPQGGMNGRLALIN